MNPFPPSTNDRLTLRRLWPAIVGVIVSGVLMALRLEFDSGWARAGVAACAFMILAVGIIATRTSRT